MFSHYVRLLKYNTSCRSVLFSRSVVSNSLQPMDCSTPMPSNHLTLCCPLSRLQSFPASGSFLMSQSLASGGQSIGASASASGLPMNIQGYSLQDGLVGSPCSPRDSQDSSPTPQFQSINSLASLANSKLLQAKQIPSLNQTFYVFCFWVSFQS